METFGDGLGVGHGDLAGGAGDGEAGDEAAGFLEDRDGDAADTDLFFFVVERVWVWV